MGSSRRPAGFSFGRFVPVVTAVLLLTAVVSLLSFAGLRSEHKSVGVALERRRESDPHQQCRLVGEASDQCEFVRTYCRDDDSSLISYLEVFYCAPPVLRHASFGAIVLWLGVLFSTIGVAASDFFSVNLTAIATLLRLSESVAGVTFLAFGNGSPDVFSTFAAMRTNHGSLAVGELYGAAGFITAVVAGSMAVVRPFQVTDSAFVRDICFFVCAVALSLAFLIDGVLELWESVVMVLFYLFYVATVVVWHWRISRAEDRRRRHVATSQMGYSDAVGVDEAGSIHPPYFFAGDAPADWTDSPIPLSARASAPALLGRTDSLADPAMRQYMAGIVSRHMHLGGLTPPGSRRRSSLTGKRPSLVGVVEFHALLTELRRHQSWYNPSSVHLRPVGFGRTTAGSLARSGSASLVPQESSAGQLAPPVDMRPRAVSSDWADEVPVGLAVRNALGPMPVNRLGQAWGPTDEFADHDAPIVSPLTGSRSPTGSTAFPPLVTVVPATADSSHLMDGIVTIGQADSPACSPRTTGGRLGPGPDDNLIRLAVSELLRSDGLARVNSNGQSPRAESAVSPSSTPSFTSGRSTRRGLFTPIDSRVACWWPATVLPLPSTVLDTLFPTLVAWSEKSAAERAFSVLAAPSLLLLTLTLPVPADTDDDDDDEDDSGRFEDRPDRASRPAWLVSPSPAPERHSSDGPFEGSSRTVPEPGLLRPPSTTRPGHRLTIDTGAVSPGLSAQSPVSSESKGWNRWLLLTHTFTVPFFLLFCTLYTGDMESWDRVKMAWIRLLPLSMLLFGTVIVATRPDRRIASRAGVSISTLPTSVLHSQLGSSTPMGNPSSSLLRSQAPPSWHQPVCCSVGFVVGIGWISMIAAEVVGVLRSIAVILNLSDAILGLTVFAVGNSLGDLVANITISRLGFPVMALSACFGGPMLNILLGIGLSGMAMTTGLVGNTGVGSKPTPSNDITTTFGSFSGSHPYLIDVSPTLVVSAVVLLITLVGLLIGVPARNWWMDRKTGLALGALWLVATTVNVILELSEGAKKRAG